MARHQSNRPTGTYLYQVWGWLRGPAPRRQRRRRPAFRVEPLEERVTPTVTTPFPGLGLEFSTSGDLTPNSSNLASTTLPVDAGLDTGHGFVALLHLEKGVSYTAGDPSTTFTSPGTVDALAPGWSIPLLDSGSFNAADLLGKGTDLVNGHSFQVADVGVTVTHLALANAGVDLQGNIALPGLGGLTVAGDVSVNANGVQLNDLVVSLSPNKTFTAGGAQFTVGSLDVHYSSPGNHFEVSGTASMSVDKQSISLGSAQDPLKFVIDNGSLTSIHAAVTSDISVAGLAIHTDPLTLDWSSPNDFILSGQATFSLAGTSVHVGLGGNYSQGLVIENGSLKSVEMSVTTDFNLKGLEIGADNLTVAYVAAAVPQGQDELVIFGGLHVSAGSTLQNVTATLGDEGNPGLRFYGSTLESVDITLNGGFNLFGVTITPEDLHVHYENSQLAISGGVKAQVGQNLGGSVDFADGGITIDTQSGAVQLHNLTFHFDADLGAFKVHDLSFSYSSDGQGGYAVAASGGVDLPGGISLDAHLKMSNGHLQSLGLSATGAVPIGDTGLYLTGVSADLENLDNISQIIVSGSVTVTLGKPVPNVPNIVEATGWFTVTPDDLQLGGQILVLGGYVAQGQGTLDLNWASGIYRVDVNGTLLGGIFDFDGHFIIDNAGDFTIRAQAGVTLPGDIPFIGGKHFGSIDFYMQYRPGDTSDSFAACWTSWDIPLFFTTESIFVGVKVDFNGNFSSLSSGDIDQFNASNSQPTLGNYDISTVFTPPAGGQVAVYNYTLQWDSFATTTDGHAFGSYGDTYAQVQVEVNGVWKDLNQELINPQTGNDLFLSVNPIDPAAIASDKALSSYVAMKPGAAANQRVITFQADALKDTPQAVRVFFHSVFNPYPGFQITDSYQYARPTVSITNINQDLGARTVFTLNATANTPAAQSASDTTTFVNLYCDTGNQGYNGTLVTRLAYRDYPRVSPGSTTDLSRVLSYATNDLCNFAPEPYKTGPLYFYATISDGTNPIQFSDYSGPVTPPNADPALQGPRFVQPVGGDLVGGPPLTRAPRGAVATFSSATHTALTVGPGVNGMVLPVTITLKGSDGGAFLAKDGTLLSIGQFSQFFYYESEANSFLDGLSYLTAAPFSGHSVITFTASSLVDGKTHTTSIQIPVVLPNAHLVVTQQVDRPHALEGDTVNLTVTVNNSGGPNALDATGVAVTVAVGDGLQVQSVRPDAGRYDPASHVWTVGNLPIGQSVRLHVQALLTSGTAGTLQHNSAAARADQLIVYPSDAANQLVLHVPNPIFVTTPLDVVNPTDGQTSLREAILQANADPEYNVIEFPYVGPTITLKSPLPPLTGGLDIMGPGSRYLTIRPAQGVQPFQPFSVAPNADVILSGVTLSNGLSRVGMGGAIYNAGSLRLVNDELWGNVARSGGAVYNVGTLLIDSSTIDNNSSTSGSSTNDGSGGAIWSSGTLAILNSTISANQATYNAGGVVIAGGQAQLLGVTVAGNSTSDWLSSTGGLAALGGDVYLVDDLIAANGLMPVGLFRIAPELDVSGVVTGTGNLIGVDRGFSGITNATAQNQVGTALAPINPLLLPLQYYNNSPTPTQALQAGSPAIGAGIDLGSLPVDQRGYGRPTGHADAGAVQHQMFELVSLQGGVDSPSPEPDGSGDTSGDGITVSQPVAVPGGPYSIHAGDELVLSADGSSSPDNGPLTYAWYLNGNSTGDAAGSNPVLSWQELTALGISGPGNYTVTLWVTDDQGNTAYANTALAVLAAPPVAVADGPFVIQEGQGLTLSAEGSYSPGGFNLSYSWDLNGDGTADAQGLSPVITWQQLMALGIDHAGTYTVSLSVADDQGNVTTAPAAQVLVLDTPPSVGIQDSGASHLEGAPISLSSAVSDPGVTTFTYAWQVSRNGVAFAQGSDPALAFTPDDNGSYDVTLTVTDAQGASTTAATTLAVANVNPTATFASDGPVTYGSPATVRFSNAADPSTADGAAGFHYAFTLDPTTLSSNYASCGSNPTAAFTLPAGTYTVFGRILDKDGGYTDYQTTLTVSKASTATALSLSASTPLAGVDDVTLTATVTVNAPGSGAVTGTVDFFDTTTGTNLGSAAVVNGVAALSAGPFGVGSHAITATYSGDGNFLSSSGAGSLASLAPASLSGTVFADFNDDGEVDFGEAGISGVSVHLGGTDDLGRAVDRTLASDGDGAFVFLDLRPGSYSLTRTSQPAGYTPGIDSVGTAGGSLSPTAADQFFVQLAAGVDGLNYNYGERPAAGGRVQEGQTAEIGFWNNKHGQALIKALNGGGPSTQLGDWLAATLPNLYGAGAGNSNLAGKSNAAVAALFQKDFLMKGVKLDAEVLATALSVYATNATLDSTQAALKYGFSVSGNGLGTSTVNVGSNGDAFGVANYSTETVLDLLRASDAQAVNGVLYNGNTRLKNHANEVYGRLLEAGSIDE